MTKQNVLETQIPNHVFREVKCADRPTVIVRDAVTGETLTFALTTALQRSKAAQERAHEVLSSTSSRWATPKGPCGW